MFKDIKNFFLDLFKNLKRKEIAKFTPVIAFVCLLAILIPTLIAIWQVYFKDNKELTLSDEISVSLYDDEGVMLSESSVSESNLTVSPLVDIFYNLYVNKSPVNSLPDLQREDPNYKVRLSYGVTEIEFSCYFTEKAESSYIFDSNGNFYTVDVEYYGKFLDTEYSDAAYRSASPPKLVTKDGDSVIPTLASWSYKKLDGTVKTSDNFVTSSEKHTYSASGSIGLSFSIAPDFCSVVVTDTLGNEIYRGGLNGLSTITATVGEHLNFLVEAEWNNGSGVDSFGSIKYNFDILCKNLASFSISNSEVSPGGYFVISAFDIEDGTLPSYAPDTSVKSIANIFNQTEGLNSSDYISYIDALDFLKNFTPSFFKDGNTLKAIVPIPYNTPVGEFTFTISSGAAISTHTVKVTSSASSSLIPITNETETVESVISKQAVDEVIVLVESLSSLSKGAMLFRGEFLSPLSHNYTREYSYGDKFTLEGTSIDGLSAIGDAYLSASAGSKKVCAANVGVVLKTGRTTHLGNFAVIDHGGGLLTWYCNLSDFDVREGDIVAKGEAIGKSGENLLLGGNGVLILCSIKGTLVDPSLILGKEILYTTS